MLKSRARPSAIGFMSGCAKTSPPAGKYCYSNKLSVEMQINNCLCKVDNSINFAFERAEHPNQTKLFLAAL